MRPHRGLPALQPGRPDAVVNNLNPKHRRRAYLAIAMERESFIRNFACGKTREAGPREVLRSGVKIYFKNRSVHII